MIPRLSMDSFMLSVSQAYPQAGMGMRGDLPLSPAAWDHANKIQLPVNPTLDGRRQDTA